MNEKRISIAIDGPVAAGKTTQAKRLAEALGFLYMDTGALYRTIACYMERHGKVIADIDEVLASIDLFLERDEKGQQRMFLGMEDVTDCLRTPSISKLASDISAVPAVREFLLDMQRAVAKEQNVVMEGRDIGTVVLPDSTVKIFLTADADIRGFRRWREMKQKGQPEDFHKVLADLADRDYNDSHREVAPLKQADDAIMLDCTELRSRETTQALLEIVREIAGI